jgi:hypothetical protein
MFDVWRRWSSLGVPEQSLVRPVVARLLVRDARPEGAGP